MQLVFTFSLIGLDLFAKYKHDHIESHSKDIAVLETIKRPEDVESNTIATLYENNKYNIRLSSIPFELFIHYLQDNKYLNLLRIVNGHLNIHIITGKLAPASAGGSSAEGVGIIGHHNDQMEEFHEINGIDVNEEVKKRIW